MLLHEPSLASTWLELGSRLRYRGRLDDRTRELIICRVGARTRSAYELHHHTPLALAAGVSRAQLDALDHTDPPGGLFTDRERDLIHYADAVLAAAVTDRHTKAVLRWLADAELVELTGLVAYYLAVSRFLAAMAVDVETDG
ncbi:MAG: carboxymuconolactone decarboxylase family protein [Actinophytocola sp.]|uniref:carboxymuconolactone decarboxylase family protein n=1 Tax=Actinophytocola sp. TaxID=1872138 RepID=UPI0013294831|nr:carboxymuconolactone decarboxylase family protein [Actinophytocola sp.]MPZ79739.1 carboxymuconolactone decarboxylase family protein [Actinophytocola sp.]